MLNTLQKRFLPSLILTPGIMLLLVWIGRFTGAEVAWAIGVAPFLLWAFAATFGIATTIALYIAYVTKPAGRE